jgi:hypothetical protein
MNAGIAWPHWMLQMRGRDMAGRLWAFLFGFSNDQIDSERLAKAGLSWNGRIPTSYSFRRGGLFRNRSPLADASRWIAFTFDKTRRISTSAFGAVEDQIPHFNGDFQ